MILLLVLFWLQPEPELMPDPTDTCIAWDCHGDARGRWICECTQFDGSYEL